MRATRRVRASPCSSVSASTVATRGVRDCGQGGVERPVLAGRRLEDPPILQAESDRRVTRALGRRSVELLSASTISQRARVGEIGKSLEGRGDRVLLVPRGHDEGHGRPSAVRPGPLGGFQVGWAISRCDQREGEKADQQARNVGEHDRDDPGHDWPDRVLEIRAPGLRDIYAESDVGEREGEG